MKFYGGVGRVVYCSQLKKFKCGKKKKGTKITGTLPEEQHTFVTTLVTDVSMVTSVTKVASMWTVAVGVLVAYLS